MKEPGDIIDIANERAEELLADALAEHYRAREAQPPASTHCVACGEEIPEARRRANPRACRCIDCQNDHDRYERFCL